ncbi:PaaI family thioesterase [Wenyingzhuangia sp. IMCC45533]
MNLSANQFNRFLKFKLPSAFICGVKINDLNNERCITTVKLTWFNKNPFKSIYFAVLAMAAELSTGALVLRKTHQTNMSFSTLVVGMKADFYKKAVGKIFFTCDEFKNIDECVHRALLTKQGESFKLISIGVDDEGDEVAKFEFTWSIKVKKINK